MKLIIAILPCVAPGSSSNAIADCHEAPVPHKTLTPLPGCEDPVGTAKVGY